MALFQIDRFAVQRESPFFQFAHDDLQCCLFIIKGNDHKIRIFDLVLLDAVNAFKDSPYPFACASGKTAGNRHLHDSLNSAGIVRHR